MKPNRRRVQQVRVQLTPQQAVLRWIAEAHQYPSLMAYVAALVAERPHQIPLLHIPSAVEQATRKELKGWPTGEVERRARQAYQDTLFLQRLHHDANVRVLEHEQAWQLHLLLLLEQLRHLLDRQLAASRLGSARRLHAGWSVSSPTRWTTRWPDSTTRRSPTP